MRNMNSSSLIALKAVLIIVSLMFENHLITPRIKKVCDKKGGEVQRVSVKGH
jgi:hypothetical protein